MNDQTIREWRENFGGGAKRKRRVRRSIIWWERFGVVVSATATILAAAAVGISAWQARIMTQQLSSESKNSSFSDILRALDTYCDGINLINYNSSHDKGRSFESSLPPSGFREVDKNAKDLLNAIHMQRVWLDGEDDRAFRNIYRAFLIPYYSMRDTSSEDYFYKYAKIARDRCSGLSADLVDWFKSGDTDDIYLISRKNPNRLNYFPK